MPDDKPVVLFATHAKFVLKAKLSKVISEIQALFPGELYPVDSTKNDFKFLALHFGWYNKYSETVSAFHLFFVYLLFIKLSRVKMPLWTSQQISSKEKASGKSTGPNESQDNLKISMTILSCLSKSRIH